MAAAVKLREVAYPSFYAEAACPRRIFAKRKEGTDQNLSAEDVVAASPLAAACLPDL